MGKGVLENKSRKFTRGRSFVRTTILIVGLLGMGISSYLVYVHYNVNRQQKWHRFKAKINGHLEACSNNGKPVDYGLKEGVSHGTADYR